MIKGQKVKENNMSNYVISCCSTADLTREHMLERNIKYACFHYELDGKEYMDDLGQSMPLPDFYKAMEAGAMTKTSQINQEEYMEYFRQFLDEGYDVLHCTLSSGISGTVNSARLAKEALEEEYPDRKIYVIDSLAASSGFGLLMDKLADLRDEGKSLDEVFRFAEKLADLRDSGMDIDTLADWTMEHRLEVNHWFFSSDLTFFIRGGRISKTAGFVGNVLNICPFMNVSNEGKLIVREKIRTKKKAIKEMLVKMQALCKDGADYSDKVYISNSACYEDAKAVADLIEAAFPKMKGKVEINDIGTTIGSHTGPGTVALLFWGNKRED